MEVHGWEEAGDQQEWEGKRVGGGWIWSEYIMYMYGVVKNNSQTGKIKFLQLFFVCHHVPLLFYLDKQKVAWYDGRSEPVREPQLNVFLCESCHGQLSQTVFVTLVW